jgi:hypothetical protein
VGESKIRLRFLPELINSILLLGKNGKSMHDPATIPCKLKRDGVYEEIRQAGGLNMIIINGKS